ncbi:MAG: glycosyltransferase family 2 protein, partial [Candidatus Omnitrophica bacterium]|nr:glycosyltransferase family 2 protein [Candidatus Omnitrophota bacterium]
LEKHSIPLINLLANRFLTNLTNILFGSRITDMETCYKLCPRELLLDLNLKANGFEIEPEITCKILKKGYRIKEVPINYNPRKEGKKINWKDGVKAIFYLFKYRITE